MTRSGATAHARAVAPLAFNKVEGLGNDFVLLDLRTLEPPALARAIEQLRGLAPRICDRRRGVGGDGLLLITRPQTHAEAVAAMVVINFDGSRPEMCGNGLRCVAAELASPSGPDFVVETDAGPLSCALARPPVEGEDAVQIRVDMGTATLLPTLRPASAPGRSFIGVSIGNPHAIHFVTGEEEPEALARALGPGVELDPVYAPAKTNVEFARVEDPRTIELWVWERGVGITDACGTGACATAFAAVERGLAARDESIDVRLPGGVLSIRVDAEGRIQMSGPARVVFAGELRGVELDISPR